MCIDGRCCPCLLPPHRIPTSLPFPHLPPFIISLLSHHFSQLLLYFPQTHPFTFIIFPNSPRSSSLLTALPNFHSPPHRFSPSSLHLTRLQLLHFPSHSVLTSFHSLFISDTSRFFYLFFLLLPSFSIYLFFFLSVFVRLTQYKNYAATLCSISSFSVVCG